MRNIQSVSAGEDKFHQDRAWDLQPFLGVRVVTLGLDLLSFRQAVVDDQAEPKDGGSNALSVWSCYTLTRDASLAPMNSIDSCLVQICLDH